MSTPELFKHTHFQTTHKQKISNKQGRLYDAFLRFRDDDPDGSTLTISAIDHDLQNGTTYQLSWKEKYRFPQKMMGHSAHQNQSALFEWRSDHAQGTTYIPSQDFPFEDGAFDWVFCDRVIEHMGNSERQSHLLKELLRIARKGIFVTTPNRWHPFEFYTALPLIHWLPASWWRRILRLFGQEIWASDCMLNLIDAKALQQYAAQQPGLTKYSVGHLRLMGIKAYFFLQILKTPNRSNIGPNAGTNIERKKPPLKLVIQ
jgi:hypothetical protein